MASTTWCKTIWEKLIFCSGQNIQVSSASVDVMLQKILQHFWFTGSNSHTQDATVDLSNVDSLPTTTSNIDIDANHDNDTIRDHAAWAIKRACYVYYEKRLLQKIYIYCFRDWSSIKVNKFGNI
jgi:hypothetical protein